MMLMRLVLSLMRQSSCLERSSLATPLLARSGDDEKGLTQAHQSFKDELVQYPIDPVHDGVLAMFMGFSQASLCESLPKLSSMCATDMQFNGPFYFPA